MYTKDEMNIAEIIEAEVASEYQQERDELRITAKRQIGVVQEENILNFNKKRKCPTQYKIGDLVSIARTQFGSGMKLRAKNFGPYEVTKSKGNERYDVAKVGDHDGPGMTSTSADNMKPWSCDV